jgi:hypothetical protein
MVRGATREGIIRGATPATGEANPSDPLGAAEAHGSSCLGVHNQSLNRVLAPPQRRVYLFVTT